MEHWESQKTTYTEFMRQFLLATGDFFPDGKGRPKHKRYWAATKKWLWNVPIYNHMYDARVFKELLFEADWRKFKTTIGIAACAVNPNQTIYLLNHNKGEYLAPDREPHALWWNASDPDSEYVSAAHAAAITAAIPLYFGGPFTKFKPRVDSEHSYPMVDGAITNNFHWNTHKSSYTVGFSTHPQLMAEWQPAKKWNVCNWWGVGLVAKAFNAVLFMMSDKMQDRQGFYLREDFGSDQSRILCELDGGSIREQESLPSWIDFASHTKEVCRVLVDRGILEGQKTWDNLDEVQKFELCIEGMGVVISGGGADGYIQNGAFCGFETRRHEYYKKVVKPELEKVRASEGGDFEIKLGRVHAITGTSAGAINALVIGWVNDMWFGENEEE